METKKRIIVPKKYHRYILGKRGQRWKELENATSTKILVPSLTDQAEAIIITGTQERIRKAEAQLKIVCDEMDSRVTLKCFVEKKYRSRVLGIKGSNVQAIRDKFNVHIQFPDRVADEDSEEVETVEITPTLDYVQISGLRDNAEAARQALLNLVPITIQVDVPHKLHYSLIGRRGCEVRELKEKYDVLILMSPPDEELDYIQIIGTRQCVEEAKKGILEKCEILKDKVLKSFELKVNASSEYFPVIVGREGVVIKKIISEHDVTITFPRTGDPEENIITITGYEQNTHNARDDILKLISELKPKSNFVFGQFMPMTQDKPVISPCESTSSLSHKTDISCEATDIQDETEEIILNGEFDSGDEDESDQKEEEVEKDEEDEKEEVSSKFEELYKNLNASWTSKFDVDKSMYLIREHADLVTEALRSRDDSQKQLTEMYTDVTSKQRKEILDLRKRLDEQVSLNKAMRNEHIQLTLDVENEREECKRIIHDNQQKYNEQTKELSEAVEDLVKQLDTERKEKSKLIAANNESINKNEELIAEKQKMEVTHGNVEKGWKSSVAELKEIEKSLTNELDELKNKQSETLKNANLKLESYGNQVKILRLKLKNVFSKLDDAESRNEELTTIVAMKDEEIITLIMRLQNKDDEVQRTKTELSALLLKNEELSKTIKSQEQELVTKAKDISDIETELKSLKTNVDEHVMSKVAHHEARIDKIKSNVSDLNEKLAEIMNDLFDSSTANSCGIIDAKCEVFDDMCQVLNGYKNTSNIQSDNKV